MWMNQIEPFFWYSKWIYIKKYMKNMLDAYN